MPENCWKNGIPIVTSVRGRYFGLKRSIHCLSSRTRALEFGCSRFKTSSWKLTSTRIPFHSVWTLWSEVDNRRNLAREDKLSSLRWRIASQRGEKGKK